MPPQRGEATVVATSEVTPLPKVPMPTKPSPMHAEKQAGVLKFTPSTKPFDGSRMPPWLQRFLSEMFIFITIHYNFWYIGVVSGLVYLATHGHPIIAATVVALYLPVYFNGAETNAEGWQWNTLRNSRIWLPFLCRWRVQIFREQELDPKKQYIFGYHPHGIVVMSRVVTYANVFDTLFPGVDCRALAASSVFLVPLARELGLWLGSVDASRPIAEKVLKSGRSITVYPGGIKEMFKVNPTSKDNVLVLKSRLGFVKLAIRHGADLVPSMVFNEKHMYHVYNPPARFMAWLQTISPFPVLFFWGRFLWMPLELPKSKPFGVVYGKPIPVTKNENPTDEELHALHDKYMAEVERIFEQYKGQYGYDADEKLIIS